MTARDRKRMFATGPSSPEDWVRAPGGETDAAGKPDPYAARLTADVTPALRGRIKIVAFRRGLTAADMLRALLERDFPPGSDNSEAVE